MVEQFKTVIHRFRDFLSWFWNQEGSPAGRAKGLALGIFSGCFPFFGFQTVMGIALARLFRGNQLIAATATWISNPITYLPLYWLNYRLGSYVLGDKQILRRVGDLNPNELWANGWFFICKLFIGSAITGSFAGVSIGILSYAYLKSRVRRHL